MSNAVILKKGSHIHAFALITLVKLSNGQIFAAKSNMPFASLMIHLHDITARLVAFSTPPAVSYGPLAVLPNH